MHGQPARNGNAEQDVGRGQGAVEGLVAFFKSRSRTPSILSEGPRADGCLPDKFRPVQLEAGCPDRNAQTAVRHQSGRLSGVCSGPRVQALFRWDVGSRLNHLVLSALESCRFGHFRLAPAQDEADSRLSERSQSIVLMAKRRQLRQEVKRFRRMRTSVPAFLKLDRCFAQGNLRGQRVVRATQRYCRSRGVKNSNPREFDIPSEPCRLQGDASERRFCAGYLQTGLVSEPALESGTYNVNKIQRNYSRSYTCPHSLKSPNAATRR